MENQYSDKQVEQIEEYASFLMTPGEIAHLMELDGEQLIVDIKNDKTKVSKAYYRGKTNTALLIRKQEVELAKIGSPMAVEHSARYLLNMDLEEDG